MNKIFIFSIIFSLSFTFISCERKSGRSYSKSGTTTKNAHRQNNNNNNNNNSPRSKSKGKTTIKMTKRGGVYEIPCKINGTSMEFIFDTGASDITISLTEAMFLYKQGTLTDDDFLGTQQYQIANGAIEEGTIINLSTVEIGDKILYNVKASIIHNMEAPLLLGQSALGKYGKISIDYNRNEITFE